MNTLQDTILTLAGGEMATATLNFYTFLIMFVIAVAMGVVMVYAGSMVKSKTAPKPVTVITDAQ